MLVFLKGRACVSQRCQHFAVNFHTSGSPAASNQATLGGRGHRRPYPCIPGLSDQMSWLARSETAESTLLTPLLELGIVHGPKHRIFKVGVRYLQRCGGSFSFSRDLHWRDPYRSGTRAEIPSSLVEPDSAPTF